MGRMLAILGALALAALLVWHPPASAPPLSSVQAGASGSAKPARPARRPPAAAPVVYVAGAVAHPGLYTLAAGARADDAVRRAGGMRFDADSGAVNLAERVADGDEVLVPVLGAPSPRSRRVRPKKSNLKTPAAVVDVNAASATDLAKVPGIGKTLAARIVEVRERDGAYASLDELLDVAGMTQGRLTRAEPYLRI